MQHWPIFFAKAVKSPRKKVVPQKAAPAKDRDERADMTPAQIREALSKIEDIQRRKIPPGAVARMAPTRRVEPWDIGSRPSGARAYDAEGHRQSEARRIAEATAATRQRQRNPIARERDVPEVAGETWQERARRRREARQRGEDPRTAWGRDRIYNRSTREASYRDRTMPSSIPDVIGHPAPHTTTHDNLVSHFVAHNLKRHDLAGVSGGGHIPEEGEIDAHRLAAARQHNAHLAAFYNSPVALPPRDKAAHAREWKEHHKRVGLDPGPVPEHQVHYGVDGVRRHQELVAEALARGDEVPKTVQKEMPTYLDPAKTKAYHNKEYHKLTPREINDIYRSEAVKKRAVSGDALGTNPELDKLHAYQEGEWRGEDVNSPRARNFMDRITASDAHHRIKDWHIGKLAAAIKQGKASEMPDTVAKYHGHQPKLQAAIKARLAKDAGAVKELPTPLLRGHAGLAETNTELAGRVADEKVAAHEAREAKKAAKQAAKNAPPAEAEAPKLDGRSRKARQAKAEAEGKAAPGRIKQTEYGEKPKEIIAEGAKPKGEWEETSEYAHNPFGLTIHDFRNKSQHKPFALTGDIPDDRYLNKKGREKIQAMMDKNGKLLPEAVHPKDRPGATPATPAPAATPAPPARRGRPKNETPAPEPTRGRGRPRKDEVVAPAPKATPRRSKDLAANMRPSSKPAGLLHREKHPVTKANVSVYHAADAGIDAGTNINGKPNKYATVCEKHGTIVGSSNLEHARASMKHPDFCEHDQPKLAAHAAKNAPPEAEAAPPAKPPGRAKPSREELNAARAQKVSQSAQRARAAKEVPQGTAGAKPKREYKLTETGKASLAAQEAGKAEAKRRIAAKAEQAPAEAAPAKRSRAKTPPVEAAPVAEAAPEAAPAKRTKLVGASRQPTVKQRAESARAAKVEQQIAEDREISARQGNRAQQVMTGQGRPMTSMAKRHAAIEAQRKATPPAAPPVAAPAPEAAAQAVPRANNKQGRVAQYDHPVTGGKYSIYHADKHGIDAGVNAQGRKNKYVTVCHKHGTFVGHSNLDQARASMKHPDFCAHDQPKLETSMAQGQADLTHEQTQQAIGAAKAKSTPRAPTPAPTPAPTLAPAPAPTTSKAPRAPRAAK